ncbi:unnamed protein product [Trichobilharzia regenti]|nr:unnamed protein product [Trichobilharzia regenti]
MDYEYRHTKGSHLLSSPVYLKGECLVKNELLENTILQRNFITADTLPVLSTDNKLLSTLRFQTENHILTPCRKDTVNPTHDECSTKEPTDDYTTFKSQPVDWLQNAVVKISDVLPQNIFDCGCGETAEKQLVQDKFDLSINECKDTCRQPKLQIKQPFGETMDTQVYTFIHRLTNSPPVYFTMKDIIRRLHISSPRFNVMCILGKKYPLDATDFIRMGLEGDWDESKAGKRMKLPVPLTWETELSVNGNNANSWTKLIRNYSKE